MANKVILPKLGTNIDKAKIIAWLKKEGEIVSKAEPLLEVETDKAAFEVEAEYGGVLKKILCPEGEEVAINKVIAIIGEAGEDIRTLEKEIKEAEKIITPVYAKEAWKNWFSGSSQPPQEALAPEIRMSPAARKLARDRKIEMQALAKHFQGRKAVLDLEDINEFLTIKKEKIAIYGAGLGAKQALEITRQLENIEIVGLIDDNPELKGKTLYGYRVLGGFADLKERFLKKEFQSVALSFHSEVRRKIFLKLKNEIAGIKMKTLVDPRAIVSSDVEIGEGVFIEAGAVIGPGVKLGNAVIVDLGAIVCHDCSVGAYAHLSPGCSLSGIVSLGQNVLVGVGASINSTVSIGTNTIITPGSAVMNNLGDDLIVSGIPAVVIGESKRGR